EPAGERGLHGVRRAAEDGAGADDPADRARHARRHGRVRPGHRARLRREDRRGHAEGRPAQSSGDRGLPRNGGSLMSATATKILELENIHTYYGSIHALKGITIDVGEGEIVTLLGANGAGKSTTLRSINGLNHPRRGKIRF